MIIIKISILYFIQIRPTDDFPSTGTRLVYDNCSRSLDAPMLVKSVDNLLPLSCCHI